MVHKYLLISKEEIISTIPSGSFRRHVEKEGCVCVCVCVCDTNVQWWCSKFLVHNQGSI